MNIDLREANKAPHRTKRHVETVQEIRHKLQGATRFSEMDMGRGYDQIGLAKDSRCIGTFQTHEVATSIPVLWGLPSCSTIPRQSQGRLAWVHVHPRHLGMGTEPRRTRSKPRCLPYPPRGGRSHLDEKNVPSERPQCPGLELFFPSPACWQTLKSQVNSLLQACQFTKPLSDQKEPYMTLDCPMPENIPRNPSKHNQ